MNHDLIHQYIWSIFSEQKDINLFIYLFIFWKEIHTFILRGHIK